MELTPAFGRIVMAVVCGEAGGGVATAARYGRKVQDGWAGWGSEGALEGRGLKGLELRAQGERGEGGAAC